MILLWNFSRIKVIKLQLKIWLSPLNLLLFFFFSINSPSYFSVLMRFKFLNCFSIRPVKEYSFFLNLKHIIWSKYFPLSGVYFNFCWLSTFPNNFPRACKLGNYLLFQSNSSSFFFSINFFLFLLHLSFGFFSKCGSSLLL